MPPAWLIQVTASLSVAQRWGTKPDLPSTRNLKHLVGVAADLGLDQKARKVGARDEVGLPTNRRGAPS